MAGCCALCQTRLSHDLEACTGSVPWDPSPSQRQVTGTPFIIIARAPATRQGAWYCALVCADVHAQPRRVVLRLSPRFLTVPCTSRDFRSRDFRSSSDLAAISRSVDRQTDRALDRDGDAAHRPVPPGLRPRNRRNHDWLRGRHYPAQGEDGLGLREVH